jgi:hypothetical protein
MCPLRINEPPEMAQDLFDYPKMVETALRGVMREALAERSSRYGRAKGRYELPVRIGSNRQCARRH